VIRSSYVCLGSLIFIGACVPSGREVVPETQSSDDLTASGRFETTAAGQDLGYDISGRISIESDDNGSDVRVFVRGLKDAPTYPAHVHNLSCAEGGGTHYQIDPTAPAGEANEVWPTVQNFGNFGIGEASVPQVLRPDARSVVVHDPDTKAKIACADVHIRSAGGSFAPLPAGAAQGLDIDGLAELISVHNTTHVWVLVRSGLTANTTYPAHVHNAACADGGGTHYEIDPNAPAGEANEIWPTLDTNEDGVAFSHVRADGAARTDAASVVIHDPVTRDKIACADLK
jgi:hypothetical protein